MTAWLHGGKYHYKPTRGHRSGLEDRLADEIRLVEPVSYEEYQIPYTIPESAHTYTPDFVLQNGIVIEAKGLFEADDRKKHLLIKKQYPHLDVRFVFANPANRLYKGAKTTYADWCLQHGFRYARKMIPASWFKESPKRTDGLIRKKPKA